MVDRTNLSRIGSLLPKGASRLQGLCAFGALLAIAAYHIWFVLHEFKTRHRTPCIWKP